MAVFQHINDISLSIPLDDTLCKAEGIFLQLKEFKKLPKAVKEVLGLLPVPVSQSMENSVFIGSASNTDVKSQDSASRVDTPQLMGGISSSSSISVNGSRSSHSLGGKQNSIIDEGSKILT